MKLRSVKIAMALGALLLASAAAGPDERLSALLPDGFVIGYEAQDGTVSIREAVPTGETVNDWSRMITDLRFAGAAKLLPIDKFHKALTNGLAESCPGVKVGAAVRLTLDGHEAARLRVDCPRLPATGKPETFFSLTVAGDKDLLNRQIAFRHVPSDQDTAWADALLAGTHLCLADSASKGC